MLKRFNFEIYPGHQFLGILIFSAALHFLLIQHLNINLQLSSRQKRDVFEVEFIRPPKIIPPKKATRTYKSAKTKLPQKSKPVSITTRDQTKLGNKELPTSSIPTKPVLTIQSKLRQKKSGNDLSSLSLSEEKLKIPGISNSLGKTSADLTPLPEDINSTITKPGNRKRLRSKPEIENLKVDQLSSGNIKREVTTEKNRGTGIRPDQNSIKKPTETDPGSSIAGKRSNLRIEGEISQRSITYEPVPPVLNIERDVTITLKFTVLPNGEVDQIFPFLKAEPELEKLAIELLHKYKFEPLFGSNQMQKGIIHFTIHRKK